MHMYTASSSFSFFQHLSPSCFSHPSASVLQTCSAGARKGQGSWFMPQLSLCWPQQLLIILVCWTKMQCYFLFSHVDLLSLLVWKRAEWAEGCPSCIPPPPVLDLDWHHCGQENFWFSNAKPSSVLWSVLGFGKCLSGSLDLATSACSQCCPQPAGGYASLQPLH